MKPLLAIFLIGLASFILGEYLWCIDFSHYAGMREDVPYATWAVFNIMGVVIMTFSGILLYFRANGKR